MKKKSKKIKNTDSIIPMGPARKADRKAHKIMTDHLKKRGKND